MSWKTYLTFALMAPLALGGIYGALGGSNPALVICRGELLVIVPVVTGAVSGLGLGFWCHSHSPPRTHAADSGLLGAVFGGVAGGVAGVLVDGVLLYKWLAH
jgi:hypothetical protein